MAKRRLVVLDGTSADAGISRNIKAVMTLRGVDRFYMCQRLGFSQSAYYTRINGETPWLADEVARAARALGVPVATLYDGLLPAQASGKWAPWDSNPQPTDYRPGPRQPYAVGRPGGGRSAA